jgi:AraC family transcriptional regulator, regulatory protein of adaptative response / methylated-DNA-[protein]-cysteine methyltransferase
MPRIQLSSPSPLQQDPRWRAVVARERAADGKFVYCVKTTGIYCRPSCPARRAKRDNISFAASSVAAERAGFRPCKRCRPDRIGHADAQAAIITKICRIIETADPAPSLASLADMAGMSRFHFHRLFKAAVGVTPKAYAQAQRKARLHAELKRPNASVTAAFYNAGFNSSGRFYENSNALLGMGPKDYRAGGANKTIRFAIAKCTLGRLLVASSDRGVCAIFFGDDRAALVAELHDLFPHADLSEGDKAFAQTIAKVVGFVERPTCGLDLPLDIIGTAFQQRVWQALREVPAGTTASYTEIAQKIGAPKSFRAVAQACAANRIAVAIPCHRIIRNDGGLSGYRGGIARKRALLEREGVRVDAPALFRKDEP